MVKEIVSICRTIPFSLIPKQGRTFIFFALFIFGYFQVKSQLPQRTNTIKGDSIFALGDSLYFDGDFGGAINLYQQALIAYNVDKDSIKISNTLNDMGLSYKKVGEFDSALLYYNKALDLDILMKDTARIIGRYRNLSNLYVDRGNFAKASGLLLDAREMARNTGYKKSIGGINIALGNLYANQDDHEGALSHYMEARDFHLLEGSETEYGIALNNIGNAYSELEIWDSAFYYLRNALIVKSKHAQASSIAYTLHDLGSLFLNLSSLDSSEFYFLKAYDLRRSLSDRLGLAQTGNKLGILYLAKSMPSKAYSYIMESREYAKDEKTQKILIDNTYTLHKYHLAVGDTVKAFEVLNSWAGLRDSILNEEKVRVLEIQSAFDLNQKEEERKLQEEEALNQSRLARQRLTGLLWLTGAALVLVILILWVIRQRTQIKRLNDNLKLVNRDMYHRKKNDYMRLLDEISALNVPISSEMKGRLLASASLDESLYEEEYDQVELQDYLSERLEDMGEAQGLELRNIQLKIDLEQVLVSGQKAKAILLVLNELITNSMKHSFAEQMGIIHVAVRYENDQLTVVYRDNGAVFEPKVRAESGMGQQIISQLLRTLRSELVREVDGDWNRSSFQIGLS